MNRRATLLLVALAATAYAGAAVADDSSYGQRLLNFIAHGTENPAGDEKSLLSTVSLTLNAIALTLMAWLAVIGGATYVFQTANKGVPGGQVISSFWAPIRISTATILLIPLASGYSTLQYGVIKMAEVGNHYGNEVASKGLKYLAENGAYRPPLLSDPTMMIAGWIGSEVCRQYINSYQQGERVRPVARSQESLASVKYLYSYDYAELEGAREASYPRRAYCGALTIDMPREITTDTAHTRAVPVKVVRKLNEIVAEMQPRVAEIASMILYDEAALRSLQNNGQSAQSSYESKASAVPEQIEGAAGKYVALVAEYNAKVAAVVASSVNEVYTDNAGRSWQEEITELGWMALGTAYWQVSQSQEKINALAKLLTPSYQEPQMDRNFDSDQRFIDVSLRLQGLQKFARDRAKQVVETDNSIISIEHAGVDGGADFIKKFFSEISTAIMKSMVMGASDGDIVTSMQYTGSVISATIDAAIHALILGEATVKTTEAVAKFAADGAVNSASQVPLAGSLFGAGATAAGSVAVGATTFTSEVVSGYAGLAKGLLFPLMIAGFFLAVVLPAIPLFFWLMGVISWALFFVECLLVSPFWMAAHGTAEKEGWGSEHTRQGYMLMIGLFLGPILRSGAWFAIFVMLKPLAVLAEWLASYLQGVIITGWVSPLLILGSPIIMALFAYAGAVRIFSLPNELFERGLRWINGGQEVTGDSAAEQHNRTIIGGYTSKMESAADRSRANKPGFGSPTPTPISPNKMGGNSFS